MNVFKAFKHLSGGKPRPKPVTFKDGEAILTPGEMVDCLTMLHSGAVTAYRLGDDGVIADPRPRTYRRLDAKEPTPIFGAVNYFYCRPNDLVYRALGEVKVFKIGSDVVLDLGQKSGIRFLARELIRDSDLSAELLDRLAAKHQETGLPGFDPRDPHGILQADEEAHESVYRQFAQELMVELFQERINRSSIQTTKMVALQRPAWMAGGADAMRRIP